MTWTHLFLLMFLFGFVFPILCRLLFHFCSNSHLSLSEFGDVGCDRRSPACAASHSGLPLHVARDSITWS